MGLALYEKYTRWVIEVKDDENAEWVRLNGEEYDNIFQAQELAEQAAQEGFRRVARKEYQVRTYND